MRNVLFFRFWRWWRILNQDELQAIQLCGVAAAVSTLLGAPLASAFFATEVMYRRRPVIEKLVYSLVASLTAFFLSHFTSDGHTKIFSVISLLPPPLTWKYYAALLLLGVLVAFVGNHFARTRNLANDLFQRHFANPWARHVVGALLTATFALLAVALTGDNLDLILGTGTHGVIRALGGEMTLWVALVALVLKLLATMSTISSGGSAGMLVPAMYLGALVGVIVARIVGITPFMLVIPAITASLVSLINVPLTAILLIIELFGASYLLPALVVLVVTILLSHQTSVYRTQREKEATREVLPGYSVRRIAVPPSWQGRTLPELGLRANYDVNVIGFVETGRGQMSVHPHVPVTRPLVVPIA